MKRTTWLYLALLLLASLLLAGCSKKEEITFGRIGLAKLTEKEQEEFERLGTEKMDVLEYTLPKGSNADWVTFWVDYYENGQYVKKLSMAEMLLFEKNSRHSNQLICGVELGEYQDTFLWSLGINGRNGQLVRTHWPKPQELSGYIWRPIDNKQFKEGDEVPIAVIAGHRPGGSVSIPEGILRETKPNFAEINADYLYILHCQFVNKSEK